MKTFLLNLYKVSYSLFNSRYPNAKPTPFGDFVDSGFVLLFLVFAFGNIYWPIHIIWGVRFESLHKVEAWGIFLICQWLIYLLLFKVWGLESRNYCLPEHKPDRATIKKTWTIVVVNVVVFFAMIAWKIAAEKS